MSCPSVVRNLHPRALGSDSGGRGRDPRTWTWAPTCAGRNVGPRSSRSRVSPPGPSGAAPWTSPGHGHTCWRRRASCGLDGLGGGSGQTLSRGGGFGLLCVPECSGPGCGHVFRFVSSDTFRVKKSPKRSPLSDPPSQVRAGVPLPRPSPPRGRVPGTCPPCVLVLAGRGLDALPVGGRMCPKRERCSGRRRGPPRTAGFTVTRGPRTARPDRCARGPSGSPAGPLTLVC